MTSRIARKFVVCDDPSAMPIETHDAGERAQEVISPALKNLPASWVRVAVHPEVCGSIPGSGIESVDVSPEDQCGGIMVVNDHLEAIHAWHHLEEYP
jgi:hypothetical protein